MSPEHERLHALWRERWPRREAALVAFVLPCGQAELDADELRNWLAQSLPAPLLPTRVVICDALPRTPAGKVDCAALRLPTEVSSPHRAVVPPRNPVEQHLRDLFEQVLGLGAISVEDDFFAHLGGHSLLATQLASLIRQAWPIEFELRTVFEQPTVAGLAASIEQALRTAPALPPAQATQPIPRRPKAATAAPIAPTTVAPAPDDGPFTRAKSSASFSSTARVPGACASSKAIQTTPSRCATNGATMTDSTSSASQLPFHPAPPSASPRCPPPMRP